MVVSRRFGDDPQFKSMTSSIFSSRILEISTIEQGGRQAILYFVYTPTRTKKEIKNKNKREREIECVFCTIVNVCTNEKCSFDLA